MDGSDRYEEHPSLRRARAFVEQNLDRRLDLGEVARVACLEPSYFSRLFKRHYGVTFSSWLRRRRIAAAGRLLADDHLTISRIAITVGFRDLRTFQRAFKRITGTTPTAVRSEVRSSGTSESV